ncbi:MAG: AMP-binding protein [Proteobacteria bacterium]|nr:AMP-binding protein [Pseudomonadota bacterium]
MSLASALDRTVRLYGRRPAIIEPDRVYTWTEFGNRVARAASVLANLGVKRGERFGILALNGFRQAELMHAGYWMGAIPVPANTRLAPPEIRHIFDDAACKLIAVDDAMAGMMDSEELSPWREGALAIDRDYDSMLADATPRAAHDSAEDDDAVLLYTGGTTGRGKGVRLTHRNVVSNGMQVAVAMRVRADDVYLHVPPMFHSADLLGTAYTLLGAAHAYLPRFAPDLALEAMARTGTTALMLTPTMVIMMLQGADVAAYDVSKLRLLFYGSSPMAAEWIQRAAEAFPSAGLQQGYGLTETSPILTTLDMEEHAQAIATGDTAILRAAGQPLIDVTLRIVSEDGHEVPMGEAGEVVVRGPNVTPGYLNRPEETKAAFRDGWFHTGDVGRVDEGGYLYLLDRKNDMIVTGGENVFSSEVEAVLYQHAGVAEAAVIGVPDERYGEALLAAIVPARGTSLTDKDIIAHCRGKIGGFKIPRRFVFLGELPKSAMGKILKTELRRTYAKRSEGVK